MLVAISAPVAAQVDVENADTDRVPMHTVIPDYPEIARRDRIEGDVQVCFNISRRGFRGESAFATAPTACSRKSQ